MKDKIKNYFRKDTKKILFFSFLIIYFILGFLLTYNYGIYEKNNFIFEADINRIVSDCSQIFSYHYRLSVHPLYVLLVQPIIFLLNGISHNDILSILLLQSIIGAFQVLIMYETLYLTTKKKNISIILSVIFGFSTSNLIFSSVPELYTLAALGLQLIWLLTIKKIDNNIEVKKFNILFILSGVLSLGIIITNYIVFLIACFVLFISRRLKLKNIIIINIITIGIFLGLNYFQKIVWNNTPTVLFNNSVQYEASQDYASFDININKVKNVISDDYYNSLFASDVYNIKDSKNYDILYFKKVTTYNIIIISLFYLIIIFVTIKDIKKNIFINIGLILSLIFNSAFHLVYGNAAPFLYSQHFVYLIIILLGINSNKLNKKTIKAICLFLLLFLLHQIILNLNLFSKIIAIASKIFTNYYFSSINVKILILTLLILYISIFIVNLIVTKFLKYMNIKIKYNNIIRIFILILYVSLLFISLETAKKYNYFLGIPLHYIKEPDIVVINSEVFEEKYPKEIEMYNKYINEYKQFIKKNETELVDINKDKNIYLFGFNDRKKLLYKNGKLSNIDSNEILYDFKIKNELIIPNIYTVLLELSDGSFVKIYENENGIFMENGNDKIIIEDKKVDLPNLNKLKYSTLLNTLYGEILFNIKDGIIYPNIIVYNKPWYRDAALTGMVLEYTDNEKIIEEWIDSIDEIYDKQNKNIKEVDNLGEVLYLLSLSKNKNDDMIEKIQKEAKKIIDSNENGNYLTGLTDFTKKDFYQNAWYNFGLKKLGLNQAINLNKISEKDIYASTTWWYKSDCKMKGVDMSNNKYPYLGYAQNHCENNTKIYLNKNLYPLSWEAGASQANYDNMSVIDSVYESEKISITHNWSASELFMLIVENYN